MTTKTVPLLIVSALFILMGPQRIHADEITNINLIKGAFDQHCLACHGEYGEASVNLDQAFEDGLGKNLELLTRVIRVLDFNEMPPADEEQLSPSDRKQLVQEMKLILHHEAARPKHRTSAPIRRMNRFQYNNAVVDLFQLNRNVYSLPEKIMRNHRNYFRPETGKMADVVTVGNRPLGKSQMIEPRLGGVTAFPQDLRAEHGYDNQADHLSLSPLLLESFLKLGQSITESHDFNEKTVGIWNSFFKEPAPSTPQKQILIQRIEKFLTCAFRRPVDEQTLERYVSYANGRLQEGIPFVNVMKSIASTVISSPKFFYLYDQKTNEERDQFDLASQLSFFLWGSIPDETLMDLATAGRLADHNVLSAQVDRMLKDRKIKRFCDSFPSQWLQLDRLISSIPNPEKFPKFYFSKYRDSMHMMLEPLLLFETVLIENLPVTQLIDSDFTYRSDLLEQAYGELGTPSDILAKLEREKSNSVTVLTYYRVPVTDRRNGGVITNAAVMTMTSGPDRTQPITRGAWIASVIFHNPPQPPPADVPPLDEKPSIDEAQFTLRERLSLHRERSDCRGCHEKIDPLGFALESYNPIGNWRETYENHRQIDTSGLLLREHLFRNVIDFKLAILAEKGRFIRALAAHLLTFGLARELGPADQHSLDEIVHATTKDGDQIHALIKQVILSDSFLHQTSPSSVQLSKNR